MTDMLLVIMLEERRAAMPADMVNSVVELVDVTPVPCSPEHIAGLAALRSRPLTVIDCTAALGFGRRAEGLKGSRTVVVEKGGHLYGLVVDSADDITATSGELLPLGADPGAGWRDAALGRIETQAGSLLLLDVDALIAGPVHARAA